MEHDYRQVWEVGHHVGDVERVVAPGPGEGAFEVGADGHGLVVLQAQLIERVEHGVVDEVAHLREHLQPLGVPIAEGLFHQVQGAGAPDIGGGKGVQPPRIFLLQVGEAPVLFLHGHTLAATVAEAKIGVNQDGRIHSSGIHGVDGGRAVRVGHPPFLSRIEVHGVTIPRRSASVGPVHRDGPRIFRRHVGLFRRATE